MRLPEEKNVLLVVDVRYGGMRVSELDVGLRGYGEFDHYMAMMHGKHVRVMLDSDIKQLVAMTSDLIRTHPDPYDSRHQLEELTRRMGLPE